MQYLFAAAITEGVGDSGGGNDNLRHFAFCASMHSVREASQAGNATPNDRMSLSEDSMEYRGLGAGKGYSDVAMGIKFGEGLLP